MNNENQDFIPADDEQETLENRVIRFDINDQRIAEAKEEFKDVDAYKDLPAAKKAKTALTKMRTALGDAHKDAKAEALAYGRRCDAEKNRLLVLIGEIEDPIKKDIDDIKNKAAKAEEERVYAIEQRLEQIAAFANDRHDLTLEQLNERLDTLLKLEVSESDFQERAEDGENAKEVSESKLRIAIMNEEARLKEVEEQERVRKENDELRKQLAKAEVAQKERDDAAAAEQKVKDDARQKELDDQAEEQRQAQKKIDDENARIAAEQKAKDEAEAEEAAEAKRIEDEEKAAKIAAIQAPDVEKLQLYSTDIMTLIAAAPVMQVAETDEILQTAIGSLAKIAEFIDDKSEELK